MKRYLIILAVFAPLIILTAGCSKKDSNKSASATSKTDASGLATMELRDYTVNVTVQNASGTGLANVSVSSYLSRNDVLVTAFDSAATYYPSVTVASLSQGSGKRGLPDRVNSPDQIASTVITITMTLYPVQLSAYGLDEAPGFDNFVSDDWTSEEWYDGTLESAYNMVDSTFAFNRGVFIHLSQPIGQSAGAPYRTAVFLPRQITNYPTFSSLAGLDFHLFAGDTLHFCKMSYNGTQLPIIHVDNVVMHRNFWAQFTLVWDRTPYDLDSHLWTPPFIPSNTRYHLCYYNRGTQTNEPYCDLDVDDTDSYGPEHMTIYQSIPGTYTYAVHDFRGTDGLITTSHAVVSLLKPDGTVQIFNAPTDPTGVQECWYWIVCSIDGTTGAVTPINTLSATPPYPSEMKTLPPKQTE